MKVLKEYWEKIKQILIKVFINAKKFIIKNKGFIFMSFPLIAMDLMTRLLSKNINFFPLYKLVPNLFTLLWIFLFLGIISSFKNKIGKWIYLTINLVFIIFYLINNIYYSMTFNFFSFYLLESVSEGFPYMVDAIKNCNILVYIFLVFIILLAALGYKNIPNNNKKCNYKRVLTISAIFIILHFLPPLLLGKANENLVWSTWKNPKNIYNLYNDSNKSMKVSGLYEYTFRNFYVTFLRVQEENDEDLIFLEKEYSLEKASQNNYTGKFKDKNLILLQLEGIDNWLITKKDTPTLYKMMNNSINFTDHYSFFNGGGSTFNSEFAVNTGFIVPFSFSQNAYTFNNNEFPYSLGSLFKKKDYLINAFHMNSGEYYSRSINYKNWGYDNYYGLIDMFNYKDEKYKLDREMIENEKFSSLMFPEDKKFVDYMITFSTHMPFSDQKGVCKQLNILDNPLIEENSMLSSSSSLIKKMTEEECTRRQAKETDYMVELLLNKLTELNLIKDTIIVAFSDHYLYTIEDESVLDKYKNTTNNLINKTPFFIWDNGKTKATIKKTTSQLNILPTILNLFGIDTNHNYYIGEDALEKSYTGIVFFSDYSWYDGNVYVEGGEVTNSKNISIDKLEEKNYLINYLAKKNDLTLKYNYFKRMKK